MKASGIALGIMCGFPQMGGSQNGWFIVVYNGQFDSNWMIPPKMDGL